MGLFPHTVTVERQSDRGTDDAGAPVPGWATVYTDIPAAIEPLNYREVLDWSQRGVTASHRFFLLPASDGDDLPSVNNRCRLHFGSRTDPKTGNPVNRYLSVVWCQDCAEAGVMLEGLANETFAPGTR
jgi:head-tail adaptor